MFREACIRFEPSFFRFLKEKPCYTLPPEFTAPINGLLHATGAIFADTDHRFRNQIARNHLQSFLLDVYDKVHRLFTHKEIEGGNRPNELFISSSPWCTSIVVRSATLCSTLTVSAFLPNT